MGRGSRVHSNKAVPISFLKRFRQDCTANRCIWSPFKSNGKKDSASLIRLKSLRFWGCSCHSHCRESQMMRIVRESFLQCVPSAFSLEEALFIHRCLLEHSLHVQIYIVHCAPRAVAGLRFNVAIKRDHLQILVKLTAETIINAKVNLSGTNSYHCSSVKSSSHPPLY